MPLCGILYVFSKCTPAKFTGIARLSNFYFQMSSSNEKLIDIFSTRGIAYKIWTWCWTRRRRIDCPIKFHPCWCCSRMFVCTIIPGLPFVPYFPYFGKCPVFVPYFKSVFLIKFYNFFYLYQFYQFSFELEAIEKKIKELNRLGHNYILLLSTKSTLREHKIND